MASQPGILTEWPWQRLGSYKHLVMVPFAVHSVYSIVAKEEEERDYTRILILPFLLTRMLHDQLWISLSRYRTARGANRIVDKSIEFDQVDRESNWDDQVMLSGIILYIGASTIEKAKNLPWWRMDGFIITILLHVSVVEFIYYWLHRALHHHFLYSRYHSHHHSSIVTEPITSVIHPFAEHLAYFFLFAIPLLTTVLTKTASVTSFVFYVTFIDFMNNLGHCNFELIPKWLFSAFPPLKYIIYTPSFHSLHHTQFRTNYALFMPFYDYIYGTMDKSSDTLYETSIKRPEESPDVVHLTHLTTPESIYHLRLGFARFASKPYTYEWYLWLMWPVTLWSVMITWIYGRTFTVERNVLQNLKLQTWAIPKYSIQYFLQWQRESINNMIEDAILEAERKGAKVLSLGLLNQEDELNKNGELYIKRYPQLKVKVVDGSSLAVAVVLHSIPVGTTQVLLRGNPSKVAYSLAFALCQRGIKVATLYENEYNKLKLAIGAEAATNIVLAKSYVHDIKTWLVGDGLNKEEHMKASKGTLFIPFTQFLPQKIRGDCFYHNTPAMVTPKNLENVDSCENWLPRRVMSAWRIAGILHALEGWNVHECGNTMFSIEKIWEASLRHGFHPVVVASSTQKS
ncbi:very-long-chain aldehyde decarbonylase CER1-like [Diospyros lotus]|uniref:very-long-chain aldehyde decarbonylase CER1-like n=1 Tax=Diospyros lotus TaxID=55363 RepID=UPI002252476C|nr:very-long-chain aldehyde decarbonylase CER1-like [Diospyros lotus]